MQVAGFIDPEWLVEVEADAIVGRVNGSRLFPRLHRPFRQWSFDRAASPSLRHAKGNHAAALRGEIRPRAAAAAAH
jgi:hypothetical protein